MPTDTDLEMKSLQKVAQKRTESKEQSALDDIIAQFAMIPKYIKQSTEDTSSGLRGKPFYIYKETKPLIMDQVNQVVDKIKLYTEATREKDPEILKTFDLFGPIPEALADDETEKTKIRIYNRFYEASKKDIKKPTMPKKKKQTIDYYEKKV